MPFAVFRRHQRKLLAIFAILAMFGFVLADSLPRLLSGGYGGRNQNPPVVTLYHRTVYRGELNQMAQQRNVANLFMAQLLGRAPFGDLKDRSLVDALILQHEADRLGMPTGPEVGREWLKQTFGQLMNRETFEAILSRLGRQVSGEQVLSDIAGQVRLLKVRQLLGGPLVTPLDVFQAYRDQNERASVRAASFPVEDFLAKVPDPSPSELEAFFDRYKDVLPDPARDTPGFKVPRQIRVEILSIDGNALARRIKETLTEPELLSYYENRKSEFKQPSEFPGEIFAGHPELTPPRYQPFAEVRPYLATSLAEEKAQAEIVSKFEKIKDEVIIPFSDKYHDALDEIKEAKKEGKTPRATLPRFEPLKHVAQREGLEFDDSPLLTREQAERYGEVAGAEVGLSRLSGGPKFAAEMFDPKATLFEPEELTDVLGRRYLVRKVEDHEPRVPSLQQVRAEVVHAWKVEKARPLAEQAAREFADQVRGGGGQIKGDVVQGRPVITTDPITKLQPGFPIPGQLFETGPPTATEIPQIPNAGEALRDAYFDLQNGAVAVAPNQPRTVYYVMTLNSRDPAKFQSLYTPNGESLRYQREARGEAYRRREAEWMAQLRTEAGLKPDWVPSDEANRAAREG